MPRNISYSLTTRQVYARVKDVTRRLRWHHVKAGEQLNAVEQAQGLRRGEQVVTICQIEVVSVRLEPLRAITAAEVLREGFPSMTPDEFVARFCQHNDCWPSTSVRRIEFAYLDPRPHCPDCHRPEVMAPLPALCGVCNACGYAWDWRPDEGASQPLTFR